MHEEIHANSGGGDRVLENRPFDDIRVGDSASLSHTLTRTDLKTFAVLSGDLNPTHVDDEFAQKYGDGRLLAHSMLSASLISSVLGNKLPGPGTQYLSQDLHFLKPVHAEETLTASVTVLEKRPATGTVLFECRCINGAGEVVVRGTAEVIAPRIKMVLPRWEVAQISVQTHDKFAAFVARTKPIRPVPTVVEIGRAHV